MADSRGEMDRLLKQIEQEAYARGYSDAIAAVTAAAAAAAPKLGESVPSESEAPKPNGGVEARGRGRPSTAIASVRDAIFEKPGMKGVDLVRYLEQRGTPVLERTVRSCLRRLKNHEARQRAHRWYPIKEPENRNGEALGAPPH